LIIHVDFCTAGFCDDPDSSVVLLRVMAGIVSMTATGMATSGMVAVTGIIHRNTVQTIAENRGIPQCIRLMHSGIGHKDRLLQGTEPIFANHQVKDSPGDPMMIGHILIHRYWDGLSGGSADKLVGCGDDYIGTLRVSLYSKRSKHVLSIQYSGPEGHESKGKISNFHFSLHDYLDMTLLLPRLLLPSPQFFTTEDTENSRGITKTEEKS